MHYLIWFAPQRLADRLLGMPDLLGQPGCLGLCDLYAFSAAAQWPCGVTSLGPGPDNNDMLPGERCGSKPHRHIPLRSAIVLLLPNAHFHINSLLGFTHTVCTAASISYSYEMIGWDNSPLLPCACPTNGAYGRQQSSGGRSDAADALWHPHILLSLTESFIAPLADLICQTMLYSLVSVCVREMGEFQNKRTTAATQHVVKRIVNVVPVVRLHTAPHQAKAKVCYCDYQ